MIQKYIKYAETFILLENYCFYNIMRWNNECKNNCFTLLFYPISCALVSEKNLVILKCIFNPIRKGGWRAQKKYHPIALPYQFKFNTLLSNSNHILYVYSVFFLQFSQFLFSFFFLVADPKNMYKFNSIIAIFYFAHIQTHHMINYIYDLPPK